MVVSVSALDQLRRFSTLPLPLDGIIRLSPTSTDRPLGLLRMFLFWLVGVTSLLFLSCAYKHSEVPGGSH